MAIAASRPEPISVAELIERIAEQAVRDRTSVALVATSVLAEVSLDEEATETLLRHGAMALANGYLHRLRGWNGAENEPEADRATGPAPFPLRGPTPKQRHDDLQRIALQDATGAMKPLASFTIADCEAYRSLAVAQVNGWSTKQSVMESAIAALTTHKKGRIADLPMKAYSAIADEARQAWR